MQFFLEAKQFFKLIRINQWTKNFLIFVPSIMAHKILDIDIILTCISTFIVFSILASIVYIINDFIDLESDKSQKYKRTRPLASGAISKSTARNTLLILLAIEILLVSRIRMALIFMFISYFILNIFYSFVLKKIVIIDLLCLTAFYLVRIFIGGLAVNVKISFWLLFFSCLLFFSLSALKRVGEIHINENHQLNSTSRGYRNTDLFYLSNVGMISGFGSVIVLGLYINDDFVISLYSEPAILWFSVPIVIYMISKLWLDTTQGKMHYDPVAYLTSRKEFLASLLLLLLVLFIASK